MKLTVSARVLVPILAVSIGQILHAAPFNANLQNGNWSDPLSWDLGSAPNTYTGDIANILGFSINYDGGMTSPAGLFGGAGGFSISNGGSLTIDGAGSMLTQTVLIQEMRIGEGSGGVGTGTGLLTIQNGGALDTGLASGLAVGSQIGGGAFGNGELDIFNGTLTLGTGAATTGFGVGIDGSMGLLKVGNGLGGMGTSIVDLATNNVQMGIGVAFGFGGGTGAATIDSDGLVTFGTGAIGVGAGGGTGTLVIIAGGKITGTSGAILLGQGAGSTGTLINAGQIGTAVTSTGEIRIGGGGGTGTFTMTGGTLNTTGEFNVGVGSGSMGTSTISGGTVSVHQTAIGQSGGTGSLTNSVATITVDKSNLFVGTDAGSTGTLTINSGTVATTILNPDHNTGYTRIGNNGGTGHLYISGGALNSADYIAVGSDGGIGHVHQTGGSVTFNSWVSMGLGGGAAGSSWDISAGSITSSAGFEVGSDRDASMNISGTANIAVGNYSVGVRTGGSGTVVMTGGTLNTGGELNVGGSQSAGSGTFSVSGGTVTTNDLNLGRLSGTGVVNVAGGATMTVNGWTTIGRDGSGTGTINVSGAGSLWQHTQSGGGDLLIGWNNGSHGAVNVTNGGRITQNWWFRAAIDPGSQGDVLVDGTNSRINQNTGRVYIGERGTGTLTVSNGGLFSQTNGDQFNVGGNDGSSTGDGFGTMNITGAGSTVSTNNFIRVGFGNTGADPAVGVVNLTGGGTLSSGGWIGFGHEGGDGTLNMTGGTLTTGSELYVGIDDNGHSRQTTGSVTISGNSAVTVGSRLFVGRAGGSGIFNLNSGTVNVNDWVRVADGGVGSGGGVTTGVLNVTGSNSHLNAFTGGGGDFFRTGNGGGNGTVNIAAGGTINTNAGWFTLGENDNTVSNVTVDGAGSTLTAHGIIVGWNGSGNGTLTISNNAVVNNTGTDHELSIGRDNANTQGTVNINSGGILNASRDARIGANGIGNLNINGGTFNGAGGWVIVGDGGSSHGTVTMTSGAFNQPNDSLMVANNLGAHGTFNQSGGTTTVGGELNVGRSGGIGDVNITGGTFNVNGWTTAGRDGNNGTGTINVSGTGVFNHTPSGGGDLLLGWTNGSHGNLNVTAGGTVNYNWWVRVAVDPGSNGAVLVDGAGSTFNVGAGRVYIGEKSAGTLTISNGGAFTHLGGDDFTIGGRAGEEGPIAGANGILTVSGAGSSLSNPGGFIRVGRGSVGAAPSVGTVNISAGAINAGNWIGFGHEGGDGHLSMSGGSITAVNEFYVGVDNNGSSRQTTGIAVVTGGTINSGSLMIGRNGANGRLTNSGGTINTGGINVGHGSAGSVGRFTQFSGTTTGTGALDVGNGNGQGTVIINGGTVSSNGFYVGTNPGGSGLVNVNNGTLDIEGWTEIGRLGGTATVNVDGPTALLSGTSQDMMIGKGAGSTGTVNILNGGQMNQNWWIILGRDGGPTATGIINVDGSGSKLTHTSGRFILGGDPNDGAQSGTGIVNISNGGWIEETGGTDREIDLGRGVGSTGTMNISTGGKFTNTTNATVFLGVNGSAGYLNVTGAGSLFSHTPNNGDFQASPIIVGWDSTSTGEVHVDTGGTLTSSQEIRVGANGSANGVFGINGGTVTAGVFSVGRNGGNGTLNMQAGSVTTNAWMTVGHDGGHGVLNLTGGAITTNTDHFYVAIGGGSTTGVVNHSAGSVLSHRDVRIGQESTATGTYNLSGAGSTVTADNELYVGLNNGTGVLNQSNGTVTAANVRIGTVGSSSGTVTKSGGTLTAVGDLTVGWQNNAVGNLTQTGGVINVGVDAYVGVRDSATGNFLMSAGTMTIGRNFIVAADTGTTGNVQFNGGTIQAAAFLYAGGTASVNFNGGTVKAKQNQGDFFSGYTPGMSEIQAGGLKFDSNGFTATANNSFDGAGGLTKNGNGTLALTAANTYAGGTVINTGVLNINADAALGNAAAGVTINNNATLQAAANVTTNRTITLGVGGGRIDTNGQIVTLDTAGTVTGTALAKTGSGTLHIKGVQAYSALTTAGGVTNIYTALGTGTSTITANAATNIYASQTLASLTIADGVEVTFGDGLPFSDLPPKPSAPFGGGGAGLVPEPGSLGLLMVGALGFLAHRRRGGRSR